MAKYNKTRAWDETRDLLKEHRGSLTIGLILMVINRASGFVLPYTSKFLVDDIIGKHRVELLMPLAAIAAAATIVQGATSFALSQVVSIAAQRAITEMRKRVQAHVLRLPISYFDSTKTGVLISRIMSDAEGVRNLVGTGLVQLVGSMLTAVMAVVVLFYINWKLTSATLVALILFGVMMTTAFKRLRPMFRERGAINAEVTGRLTETIGGIRLVKVYTAEARERLVFARGAHKLFRNVAKTITGTSAVGAGTAVLTGLIGVLLIVIGGRSVLNGSMTLGDMFMYVFFIGLLAAPLVQISSIGTQVSEAFAGLDRIREIRDMATEDQADPTKASIDDIGGRVEFQDVSFEYVPGAPVLKHVSFVAPEGSTTALVGASGGGKSTLIGLVMAFNQPKSGRVRENIAYTKPGAPDAEVIAAARIAHCDEFVSRFEKGYDTIVGERGVKLSGGQRQRVAIARAVLADPRVLILDEATSSLDSESEALIRDGLRSLRQGRTTFVIAHRLSTIESANQILVLESGEIVERGTHSELLALGGRYRQLYEKQYGAQHDEFINPGEDFSTIAAKDVIRKI
jgi:ABC-type multidrug transport system fused ATPase/permease subunit